jgi:bisphosphoglycerate-dependent phosphoglycerate mutase
MTDTPLTDDGILEAKTAGKLIGNEDIKFDAVYTSLLRRSIKTVWMVLQEIGPFDVPKNVLSSDLFLQYHFFYRASCTTIAQLLFILLLLMCECI